MFFSVVLSEVVGAASDFYSGIHNDGRPHLPTESGITVVVCPHLMQTMQEAPLSHLGHTGGAAPTAPSCMVLGRDSDQVSVCHPE